MWLCTAHSLSPSGPVRTSCASLAAGGFPFLRSPARSCNCANSPCRCMRTRIGEKRPHMKSARQRKKSCAIARLVLPRRARPKTDGHFFPSFPLFSVDLSFFVCLFQIAQSDKEASGCVSSLCFFLIEKSTESAKKKEKNYATARGLCVPSGRGDRLFSLAWPLGEPRNLTCRSQFALCPFFVFRTRPRPFFSFWAKWKRGRDWVAIVGRCADGPPATGRAAANSTSRRNRPASAVLLSHE